VTRLFPLVKVTVAPPEGAVAVRLTAPVAELPAITIVGLKVTEDIVGTTGATGVEADPPPHPTANSNRNTEIRLAPWTETRSMSSSGAQKIVCRIVVVPKGL
jgi:hypothetical protein